MSRLLPVLFLLASAACATAAPERIAAPVASAQEATLAASEAPVDRRAAEMPGYFADPESAIPALHPLFLAAVPPAQFSAVLSRFTAELGACTGVRRIEGKELEGVYELRFERGATARMKLAVERDEPHLVVGLQIGPPVQGYASLEEVVAEIATLPGKASFLYARIGPEGIEPIVAHRAEEQLAIGSAFKLYVLAELVRAVEAGERSWDEVVPLEEPSRSLSSAYLQNWPTGAPLTLHTLAAAMIAVSDNTATDQLIRVLGRESIERMVEATGHAAPERNRPFLTTREFLLLKGAAGEDWLALDASARRRHLEEVVAARSLEEAIALTSPTQIDSLEWFASARDLALVLAWLQRHAAAEDSVVRGILGINPGLPSAKEGRRWVGHKGGSEPGVLNGSWLLEQADGSWAVMVFTWNDPQAHLDRDRYIGLATRALSLIGGQVDAAR